MVYFEVTNIHIEINLYLCLVWYVLYVALHE
jgi:hypothetical protein